jgi:hypothetical protein
MVSILTMGALTVQRRTALHKRRSRWAGRAEGVIGNSRPADLTLWSAELFPCSADLIPGSLG